MSHEFPNALAAEAYTEEKNKVSFFPTLLMFVAVMSY